MNNLQSLRKNEFNLREERLKNAKKQNLRYQKREKQHLNITYVMTWTGVCGGSKIILEHANRLTNRGHKITLISHDNKPVWFNLNEKVEFIQVPWESVLCESIPKDTDVIVSTYWREIYECVEQKIAPVIYFEQGDFHLFDLEKVDNRTYNYINKALKTIHFTYTVSSFAKAKLKEVYNTEAKVIPNAVDDKVFYYEPHKKNEVPNITIIGSEEATFKRIQNIIDAIEIVKEKGYNIKLNWITPTKPEKNINLLPIINPPQIVIGDTLRKTDIYICASMYEAFCLPVLEAMTCGAAIITTNNGGNMDFIEENKNALIIEKDNINDIVQKVETLLNNQDLRESLVKNGVEEAARYSWNITINKVEEYYQEIANYVVE